MAGLGQRCVAEGAVTSRIMAGRTFFALDTATGALRWRYDGKAIAHPAIAIADGVVYLADCNVTKKKPRRPCAKETSASPRASGRRRTSRLRRRTTTCAACSPLDAATGEKRWERVMDLTGCGGDRMGLACKDGVLCFFGCFSNHDRSLFRTANSLGAASPPFRARDAADLWSKPLNYLRRPVIIGDDILVEPRMCGLHDGAIRQRVHPMTGEDADWEFVRPGHCCSVTSACPSMFFLRGYFLWYYDLVRDQGMLPFGGIRPGCWINTIPANGLLLFPDASAGCTCSYPVTSTVALEPRDTLKTFAMCVQHGPTMPVKHLAINFGAPGDWRDDDGRLWFSYPQPPNSGWHTSGVNFDLHETFADEKPTIAAHSRAWGCAPNSAPGCSPPARAASARSACPCRTKAGPRRATRCASISLRARDDAPGARVLGVEAQGKPLMRASTSPPKVPPYANLPHRSRKKHRTCIYRRKRRNFAQWHRSHS